MNFKNFENHLDFVCRPASHHAVRRGSARCTAPEIQHSKGYPFPFMKLLFRRLFIHCTMVILLYSLSLFSSLSIGMRKQFQRDHNMLFNQSLQCGQLPHDWKCANVIPVFKKGSKFAANNYGPISLTSQIVKILEYIVCDNIH